VGAKDMGSHGRGSAMEANSGVGPRGQRPCSTECAREDLTPNDRQTDTRDLSVIIMIITVKNFEAIFSSFQE